LHTSPSWTTGSAHLSPAIRARPGVRA
jgi:hypothetical protein